jgi:ankyrin repeat protein
MRPMSAELFEAIRAGDADRVGALVADDPLLAEARGEDGVSAVLTARYRSQTAILETLLAAEPELDVFDAAATGRAERVAVLLAADPRLVWAWSVDGFTALHLAAFFGHLAVARSLAEAGADIDPASRNAMQVTPLHSASAGGHTAICELLIDRGADVNAVQRDGFTPLHAAAQNGDERLLGRLLAEGADAAVRLDDGRTAADLADAAGHAALAARLRSA